MDSSIKELEKSLEEVGKRSEEMEEKKPSLLEEFNKL